MFYDKDINNLHFYKSNIKIDKNIYVNKMKADDPNLVEKIYNDFKKEFSIDSEPEPFVYQEKIKNNKNKKHKQNNFNYSNKNYNNNNYQNRNSSIRCSNNNYNNDYNDYNDYNYKNYNNYNNESNHDDNNNINDVSQRLASFKNEEMERIGRVSINAVIWNAGNSRIGRFESNGDK